MGGRAGCNPDNPPELTTKCRLLAARGSKNAQFLAPRSSMGKLATGTGSGLQGTENLWAAVEGLADMVRELKDNEKLDRENMARSGVYSKWLEAEHVKKSAGSGYAKYGTKQNSIEGALEELNDTINHYNSICSMQKEKQQE